MSGSTLGVIFKVSTWGESHGEALGVVVDGCPSGVFLDENDIQTELDKRKPGTTEYATKRNEPDNVKILSGVFNGKTTGTPISMIIYNQDQKSRDYGNIADIYRPGHADYTFDAKFGFRDYRGGGRSSGRETAARVAAGAVAKKILKELQISITAYTLSVNRFKTDPKRFDLEQIAKNPLKMPDAAAAESAMQFLDEIKDTDSAGGVIECIIDGLPAGIGEPVFDKLDSCLAKALMSIGAVKGFEIGVGFACAEKLGSDNNDSMYYDEQYNIKKSSNNAGGILGGISDGSQIIIRAAVKPTPSISKPQQTINNAGENVEITVHGRHDPIIVPRAVPVVEAMVSITLVDQMLINMSSKIEMVKKLYER